jgi:excinuclease UvrABC helicase subunit UvrB
MALPVSLMRLSVSELRAETVAMRKSMFRLARNLDFEKAAELRDRIRRAEEYLLQVEGS